MGTKARALWDWPVRDGSEFEARGRLLGRAKARPYIRFWIGRAVLEECSPGYRYIEELAFDGGSDFWGTGYSRFEVFVRVQRVQDCAGYVVVDF